MPRPKGQRKAKPREQFGGIRAGGTSKLRAASRGKSSKEVLVKARSKVGKGVKGGGRPLGRLKTLALQVDELKQQIVNLRSESKEFQQRATASESGQTDLRVHSYKLKRTSVARKQEAKMARGERDAMKRERDAIEREREMR